MSTVLYSAADHIGVITLNRPEACNVVNPEMAAAIEDAVDRIEADPDVWVGVLCANVEGQDRPVFCVGADLKGRAEAACTSSTPNAAGSVGFAYRERTKPIVVAIMASPPRAAARSCSPATSRAASTRRCSASPRSPGT